jgi:hypothetical protein
MLWTAQEARRSGKPSQYVQHPRHEYLHCAHWLTKTAHLERHAAVRRVLEEYATVDLTLVQVARLVSVVDDIRRSGGLLEYAELELAATNEVDRLVGRDGLELGGASGVVNGYLAIVFISTSLFKQRTWQGKIRYVLLVVVQLDRKVLPVLLINQDAPNRIATAIQQLEAVLVCIGLANQRPSLELDLVRRVVRRLVPCVQVLVRQVQRARGVLLDAEVQRLDALTALAVWRVFGKLQSCAAEAVLLLEDGLVRDGDFNGGVLGAVEARGVVGELEDLAPLQVIALDVVRVEKGIGCVEERWGGIDGNAAVKNDGALGVGALLLVRVCENGRGRSD